MNIRQFVKSVDHDTELEGWDMDTDNLTLTVRCKAIDQPGEHWYTTFPARVIHEMEWEDMKEFAMGRRKEPLDVVTRIVGYYSRVSNWNKSKVGELNDRRKGDYGVGDTSGLDKKTGPAKEKQ